eukprot:3935728-Rhodomonas_salina.1
MPRYLVATYPISVPARQPIVPPTPYSRMSNFKFVPDANTSTSSRLPSLRTPVGGGRGPAEPLRVPGGSIRYLSTAHRVASEYRTLRRPLCQYRTSRSVHSCQYWSSRSKRVLTAMSVP